VPLLRRHIRYFSESSLSGVVNQNVESTEFCIYRLEKFAYVVDVADVGGMPENPAKWLHFADSAVNRFLLASANGDQDSLAQQVLGDRPPDSACAARNNRNPSGE
jgi:hypothetical protein